MNVSLRKKSVRRLEVALIAFFLLAASSAGIVYYIDASIYTQALSLPSSPNDHYPVAATVFMICLPMLITLLIIGVVRHWRWVFWLVLIAFNASILQFPVAILQFMHVVPDIYPLWYSLFRLGVGLIQVGIGVWMIQIYRHEGVWAMGRKKTGSSPAV